MSKIDIFILDNIDPDSSEAESAFENYVNNIIHQFEESPEGKLYSNIYNEIGFWSYRFVDFAYNYSGVSLPNVKVYHVDEILNDLFPRKITINSPDEANRIIPELIVFWEYLKRDYSLINSNKILEYLEGLKIDYYNIMNDESRFGPAKSFYQLGKEAGFDMHNEKSVAQFVSFYNASLLLKDELANNALDNVIDINKKLKSKKKRLRKLSNKSRKKNRKK